MKEITVVSTDWPHKRVVCYSCSIGGTEVAREISGDETGVYTTAQLGLLDKLAKTHDRSKHQGIGHLVVRNYVRENDQDPGTTGGE